MVQKLRSIVLIIIGIIAIGLAIKCFTTKSLGYESTSMYGGDAFTGIQNAAAITSKNVKELASIVQFGFGSILLVMGLTCLGFGLTTPMGAKQKEGVITPEIDEVTIEPNIPIDTPIKEETPATENPNVPPIEEVKVEE